MPDSKRVTISAASFLLVLVAGVFWANAESAQLSGGLRFAICFVIGILLALSLYFLLRPKGETSQAAPS